MARMSVTPAEIEAFLSLAETGSFSRTGLALGLSQPAVSARIRHLERVVGVPLFNRTTRRVTITAAGDRLRARLDHTMVQLRGAIEELRDEANLQRGRLTVGASPSVAAAFVAEVVGRFHVLHPRIEVALQDDFYGHALDRLRTGEVDLVVTPVEGGLESFDVEPLLVDRFLLAVAANHALARKPEVTMEDLRREALITMPPETVLWTTIKRAFEHAGLAFRPAMQTRNLLTVMPLVRAGYGVAFVNELQARLLPMAGITTREVSGANLRRHVGIIASRGRVPHPAVEAFKILLRETVAGPEFRMFHAERMTQRRDRAGRDRSA